MLRRRRTAAHAAIPAAAPLPLQLLLRQRFQAARVERQRRYRYLGSRTALQRRSEL